MGDYWKPDDDGDNEEYEEELGSFSGRDGVLFLVDAGTVGRDEEQLRNCVTLIETTMMNRIIQSEEDLIGVVFYNTEHSPLPEKQTDVEAMLVAPKNTAIFMHLSTMSKETIAYMKHFKEPEDFFDFKNRYGSVGTESFMDVIWLCSRMLMSCGYKLKQSNIFLFTNNDQPHPDPSGELDKCLVRGKDLRDLGVHFTVVPMVDDGFNVDKFYREFVCSVNDLDAETYEFKSPSEQRDILSSRASIYTYKAEHRRTTTPLGAPRSTSEHHGAPRSTTGHLGAQTSKQTSGGSARQPSEVVFQNRLRTGRLISPPRSF